MRRSHPFAAQVLVDAHVVLFDYSGFGRSSGTPSERQTRDDLEAVLDSLPSDLEAAPLVLYGFSMGASVCIDYAAGPSGRRRVQALVADSPPASVLHAISSGTLASPASVFRHFDPYRNVAKIADVKCPVFFIAGTDDPVCPPDQVRRLLDAAPKALATLEHPFIVPGGSHGDALRVAPEEFAARLRRFLAVALSP